MKLGVIAAIGVGLILATAVIGWFGFGAVLHALARVGWRGYMALCAYSLLPILILGGAWFVLGSRLDLGRYGALVWARMVRDAASEHLPFSQFGGFVIGARAAILNGVSPTEAFATTVVDATAELIAQIAFIGLGVGILAQRLGGASAHSTLLGACLVGLMLCVAGAWAFIALQRRGSGVIGKLSERFLPGAVAHAAAVTEALGALYRRPVRIGGAALIHLAAWTASGAGAWLALHLAGAGIGLTDVLAIESLLGAVRSAAFLAPMAVGVQEAGYALVGPLFGLAPDMALALSLIKRARDLTLGVPTLLAWQGLEAQRLLGGPAAALESAP